MRTQLEVVEAVKEQKKVRTRTRTRYSVLFLLFIITAINYMDRASISIVAPAIQAQFELSPAMLGLIFSAFSWTYAVMQIPGGLLVDRFGSRLTYGLSLISWSIATGLQALANGFAFLLGTRMLLGITESPAFPANNRVATTWFPQNERAFASSVFSAGQYMGLAFATPVLFWLMSHYGWRSVFVVLGVVGILISIFWFKVYQDPKNNKKINQEELAYIREGGALADSVPQGEKITLAKFLELLKYRQLLGLYIGQFAIASTLFFFLTWFPTYLAEEKSMSFLKVGVVASIPYIAAFFGVLFGGVWSDWMLNRGYSINIARKLPVVLGLLLTSSIILANYTSSTAWVIAVMSVAFFAQGMSNTSWAMLAEIAPRELVGVAGGVFSFFGNLAGILTPMLIGFIVALSGSYAGAIIYIGAVAVIGAVSYIFIVGKVKRIELNPENE